MMIDLMQLEPLSHLNLQRLPLGIDDHMTREVLFLSGLPIIEGMDIDDSIVASRFFPAFFHAFDYKCLTVTRQKYLREGLRESLFPLALKYLDLPFSKAFRPCNPLPRDEWLANVTKALQDCLNLSILNRLKHFTIEALIVELPKDEDIHQEATKLVLEYMNQTLSPSQFGILLHSCYPTMRRSYHIGLWEPMQTCLALTWTSHLQEIELEKATDEE